MVRIVSFKDLPDANLVIDAVYQGEAGSQLSGEPLSKLLPGTGNLGGFRASGRGNDKKLVVLYTSGEDKDWPDRINVNTGQFVYYGDNKTPGHELHETRPGGNRILKHVFAPTSFGPARSKTLATILRLSEASYVGQCALGPVQGACDTWLHGLASHG